MITLETVQHCYWRNSFAPPPVFIGTVSFGDAFAWTTRALSQAVRAVLNEKLPGILPQSGDLAAPDLVARLAQHIQCLNDIVTPCSGVASWDDARRSASLFFAARDPFIAPHALSLAVQVVDRLAQSDVGVAGVLRMVKSCEDMIEANGLGLMTREMVGVADSFDIPWFRINNMMSHVQLGQGYRQRRFRAVMFGDEKTFARDYAKNKLLTLDALSQIMLPTGKFGPVKDIDSALRVAEKIGYPVVLKPVSSGQGDSVFVDLRNENELKAALQTAKVHERPFMLQSFFEGNDYRMLVVDGKLLMVEQRVHATIKGDGKHTVAELVAIENDNPARTSDATMVSIELDWDSDRVLSRQGLTRGSVVAAGHIVRLKGMANVAAGGTPVTVTSPVHPDNERAAVRAARAVGLVVAGVDLICPDISKSWHETGGGFCEVNTTVGLPDKRMTPGLDLRRVIMRTFYPEGDTGRIPTAMVTGTFGKTTVTLMLASILTSAGHNVGSATTESIRIGEEDIASGDFAGASGASVVLRDATVTAAVLETARGGIIKHGTYLDHCDVAALLNVQREQIGMDDIETLEDMVALKRKVLDAARKAIVLNADDPLCLALLGEFAPTRRTFLFSRNPASQALRDYRASGGDVLFTDRRDGHEVIVAASGPNEVELLKTGDVPVTRKGLFWQHASNAMAAAALAIGLGIDLDTVRQGLKRYGKEFRAASCRLTIHDEFPVPMVFDYAASPPGFAATIDVTNALPVSGRRFCAVTVAGNRPDWTFKESATALAGHFDRYVVFELEKYRRGRKPGEIAARLSEALIATGVDPTAISIVGSHESVAALVAREATERDLVVVFGMHSRPVVEHYRAAFREVADAGRRAEA